MGEGFYQLATRLRTTIVVINELPTVPETLLLRLMGKGQTQRNAIAELLLLPDSDARRMNILDLLVSWRISMELLEQADQEERRILMALSQAYLEWEQKTRRKALDEGRQEGRQEERHETVLNLLMLRFGAVDEQLRGIIPALIELSNEECMQLVVTRSREELLQQFAN